MRLVLVSETVAYGAVALFRTGLWPFRTEPFRYAATDLRSQKNSHDALSTFYMLLLLTLYFFMSFEDAVCWVLRLAFHESLLRLNWNNLWIITFITYIFLMNWNITGQY